MAKFYGKIGFGHTVRTGDISEYVVSERTFKGDIIRPSLKESSGESVIPNLTLGNLISVIEDPYLFENLDAILYVTVRGVRWSVRKIDIVAPRLNITLGEVFNGPTPSV